MPTSALWRVREDVREGRFQRSLALLAGLSSLLSGLEVAYEHYRGSYSRRVMYLPLGLSAAMLAAGLAGFRRPRAARTLLPLVSLLTLAGCGLGFYFHIRGIRRKPGGWSLPLTNLVLGPPLFAPLLFGISAVLGLTASRLRRSYSHTSAFPRPAHPGSWTRLLPRAPRHESIAPRQHARERRFQTALAASTAVASACSGIEAAYSHYKNNFRYAAQWTPVLLAPALTATALVSLRHRRAAYTWLPAVSALAVADGAVGFFYHARGVARRPGGLKMPVYNIIYGPPIFAPLLFAACGFLGLLASLLGRKQS